jgi:hypothetical protein
MMTCLASFRETSVIAATKVQISAVAATVDAAQAIFAAYSTKCYSEQALASKF